MSNFCINCGEKRESNARFCAACGATFEQAGVESKSVAPGPSLQQTSEVRQSRTTPAKGKKKMSVILIIVAFLIIAFGIQSMSLNIIGKTTTATITKATQDRRTYDGSNIPNPNRFNIIYEFYANGEKYIGNGNHIFKMGIKSTQTIRVVYMPFFPKINALEEDTKIAGGLLMTGIGILLLVLAIKGKSSSTKR